MPDTKITALAAIGANPINVATFPIPMVDLTDTSMAASGTTKKVTVNQILGAGGTATLASATITGDLTVATSLLKTDSANTRVGIGTNVPSYTTHIRTLSPVLAIQDNTSAAAGVGGIINFLGYTSGTSGANVFGQVKGVKTSASVGGELQFFTSDSAGNSVQRYLIDSTGVSTWSVAGSTAMTLNATGLGVGVSPGYKLDVAGSSAGVLRLVNINNLSTDPAAVTRLSIDGQGATWHLDNERTNGIFKITRNSTACLTIDNSANVGIGVAPSYRLDVLGSATISGRFKTSGALNALYLEDSGTTAGSLYIGTSGNEFRIVTGSNVALAVDGNRNFAIGPTSVTTTATDGFVYVPVCAGAPTGTPTAKGGRAAFVVDSTNNRFYVYVGGAWKYAALV